MSQDGSIQRAFSNSGQVNDVDIALGKAGLTPVLSQLMVAPSIARQVADVLTGSNVKGAMSKNEWVERELAEVTTLFDWGMSSYLSKIDADCVARAWKTGHGLSHLYVPRGLGLLTLAHNMVPASGVKTDLDNKRATLRRYNDVTGISTRAGVLVCDLQCIMSPTDKYLRPFSLSKLDQFSAWAQDQGGSGLSSVEEALYILLRAIRRTGFMPFAEGKIVCCNESRDNTFMAVSHTLHDGLRLVYCKRGSITGSRCLFGGIPRVFVLQES